MAQNQQSEIEGLFEKYKETILQGINRGLGLRKICFGYDVKDNPEGDPNKSYKTDGGILAFINYCKSTNTPHLTVGAALTRLFEREKTKILEREKNKKLDKLINNNSQKENTDSGLVDERFELCSIIAQLAGCDGYTHKETEKRGIEKTAYQSALLDRFKNFADHPAVKYLQEYKPAPRHGVICALAMALNKADSGFVLGASEQDVNNNDLNINGEKRITADLIKNFLPFLNSFSNDSKFNEWFKNNTEFYREFSKNFTKANELDFAWYEKFGMKRQNMNVVVSPTTSAYNYGITLGDKSISLLQAGNGGAIVHEFCHPFGNQIAGEWFKQNSGFRDLCEQTMGSKGLDKAYDNPQKIGNEYVVRAFTIIYHMEHSHESEDLTAKKENLLAREIAAGFPLMTEVLDMAKIYNNEIKQKFASSKTSGTLQKAAEKLDC